MKEELKKYIEAAKASEIQTRKKQQLEKESRIGVNVFTKKGAEIIKGRRQAIQPEIIKEKELKDEERNSYMKLVKAMDNLNLSKDERNAIWKEIEHSMKEI